MSEGFNNRPGTKQSLIDNIASNVSGIISTRPSARYASGARSILKMNGKIVGFAFDISWRITTQNTEITTIDDYLPYELAPQRVSVEGTMSALHIPGTSAATELWQPDVLSFLFHKYFTIEVRDIQTDALLFATQQAVITSRTEDAKVDQLNNVQLTWKAIGYLDERQAAAPKGHDGSSSSLLDNLVGRLKLPF